MNNQQSDQIWYRPRDIVKLGLIHAPRQPKSDEAAYRYIINLIKRGQLAAQEVGVNKKYPYYLVSLSAVKRFNSGKDNMV